MTAASFADAGVGRRLPHPAPVFVLAPARSGSTVTIALLSGHPDIYAFPELLLFEQPTIGALLDQATDPGLPGRHHWEPWWSTGLLRTIAELFADGQDDDSIRWAQRWLRAHRDLPTAALMRRLLDAVAPRVGVEKSPGTTDSDDALTRCLNAFPDARLLHLTRHPVTTQQSMRIHWNATLARHSTETASAVCATAWYTAHRRIVAALDRLPAHRSMRVRVEDLFAAPHEWLPRVLRWLGMRHDDDIIARMRHTERWRYASPGPSGRLYGGDPAFMHAPHLRPFPDPGPVHFPAEWRLPPDMEHRMTTLAADLGY